MIQGCAELNAERGHSHLSALGNTVAIRACVAYVLATLLNFLPAFVDGTFELICVIASFICSIIAYIQYLSYIKKTSTAILTA